MPTETLTPAGERYAKAREAASIVARVALRGGDAGWPAEHVDMAIRMCNRRAVEVDA